VVIPARRWSIVAINATTRANVQRWSRFGEDGQR
jgi:hypothetical protein